MGIKARFRGGNGAGRYNNPYNSPNDPEGQRTVAQERGEGGWGPDYQRKDFDPFSSKGKSERWAEGLSMKAFGEDAPWDSPAQQANRKNFVKEGKKSFIPAQPVKGQDLPF